MFIKMKEDHKGPVGTFLKDQEYKAGGSIVKRLPENSFEVLEGDAEKKAAEKIAKIAADAAARQKADRQKAAVEEMSDEAIDKIAERVADKVAAILAKK